MTEINTRDYPYFDLYDRESRYTKILPYIGGTTQPRDLIEAQSMLQDQITRLADTIYINGSIIDGCEISVSTDKTRVTISPGSVYLDGQIENFIDSSVLPISGIGLEVVGLVKTEEIITDIDDPNLKNPATNFDYYDPTGSYRIKTIWTWAILGEDVFGVIVKTLNIGTIIDGIITTNPPSIDTTQALIDRIMKMISNRDYAQSGNYILNGLSLKLVNHPQYKWNMKQVVVTSGTARILGVDTKMSINWLGSLPVARDTSLVQNEPWIVDVHNPVTNVGGQHQLGNRPVSSVRSVVATVLVVDGYGLRSTITRSPIRGGSDQLSNQSVTDILAVNQGGIWDPSTEQFVGGTTFPLQSYLQDGNKVSWSPIGSEPDSGTSYSVAYRCRKPLTKQIMVMDLRSNENLVMGSYDVIIAPYICEVNQYTEIEFKITDVESTVDTPSDYEKEVDFTVLVDGTIDWYNHRVQEIIINRTAGSLDTLDPLSISLGYSVEGILGAASMDGVFDSVSRYYSSGTAVYQSTRDYLFYYTGDNWVIDWTPSIEGSVEPPAFTSYKIAILIKIPKSDNQPTPGNAYFATYYYWRIAVFGDYLCRDSFFSIYDINDPSRNTLQHYGLDLQDYVNFWRSYNYINNPYNMDKPYPGSLIEFNYDYYLSRYAVINYTSGATVTVTLGTSADNPSEVAFDENSSGVMLGTIFMPADGLNMVLHEFGVSTLKVVDLQNLKSKVIQNEQALAETWLDMQAKNMPVSNKKGVSTSSFRNDNLIDKGWPDIQYAIDPDWETITLPHTDSFHSIGIDIGLTTGSMYQTISTIIPVGVDVVSQDSYTSSVSLSPYIFSDQSKFLESQSISMNLTPSGDFLAIPRTSTSLSVDSDIWRNSDISKLDDPSPWFSGGWRGNQEDDQKIADQSGGSQTVRSDIVAQDWTRTYIAGVDGNCRQVQITFRIDGGLPDPNSVSTDFYLYFGGILADVTPIENTPVGSVSGTFRPRQNRTASGTFIIPENVAAGQVEVKVVSSPIVLNGQDWRYVSSSIYNTTVSTVTTKMLDKCRCNCYSCNRCANCWSCVGRCGTGPLSETLQLLGNSRVLRSLEIDYFSVSPIYGTYASVVSTENGQPTSNTIANSMLGRKYLSPDQLSGAGPKLHTFDNPIYVKSDTYAILLTAEDGYNLNAASEIMAGRDIKVKISKIGETDLVTNTPVSSKQFRSGAYWKSQTGLTWVEDDTVDLKFKASFNVYPVNTSQTIQMESIDVVGATAFICTWNSQIPEGTSIVFQYTVGNGIWVEFSPFALTQLSAVADQIIVRSILLTTSSSVSPFVENTCGIYVQSKDPRLYITTRQFELAEGETADSLDVWVDSHLPSGYSQKLRVTFDNGLIWVDLDYADGGVTGAGYIVTLVDIVPVNLNVGEETYTYHWNVVLPSGSHFTEFRVELNLDTTISSSPLSNTYPTLSNYIAIPSNT